MFLGMRSSYYCHEMSMSITQQYIYYTLQAKSRGHHFLETIEVKL